MKKIAVVTATRAEYGLLSPVIQELRKMENENIQIELIVTGTHLSEKYGMTIKEIEADGERIDHKIFVPIESGTALDISSDQASVLVKFTGLFMQQKYDAVLLLGDRYETLMIAIAAGNTKTPIFHLCGGDTTEGALDEWIRHSITKISYLHFVTNEDSRRRVIQLGENPERVFNYGSTSIDNIMRVADLSKTEVLESINLQECKYAVCTYHPVTMENDSIENQIDNFLTTIEMFSDIQFIVTKSNADLGGARINELLDRATKSVKNLHVFTSLGIRKYLSLMKYAEFLLGNSSSGIIEAPVFQVPTINIGDRQRGRLQSKSIINCKTDSNSIAAAIQTAMSDEYKSMCKNVISPYGSGNTGKQIAHKVMEVIWDGTIDLKKKFFDL